MFKVLIYKAKQDLKPIGGPNGYLFNLYDGIKQLNDPDIKIDFLPNSSYPFFASTFLRLLSKHKKILFFITIQKLRFDRGRTKLIDFSKYDIIHFHSPLDYYVCRESLKDFHGKVVLTCHSPMPVHMELVDYLNLKSKKKINKYRRMVEKIDIFAFNNADYILLPCEEAEECFYNTWDKYAEIRKNNKYKYIYIPTGLIDTKEKFNDNIRNKYGYSESDLVISYVGRHNEVKGFKSLKRIGNHILDRDSNVKFLIAGEEKPIRGLDRNGWKEIGWTNKPHEIIAASDIFILPNKETYFDLIMLEVLSLGKPVLATETGGNKFYRKFKDSGIFLYKYDDISDFMRVFDLVKNTDLKALGKKNKKIFKDNFSSVIFAKKYLAAYKNIAGKIK